eukprot:TRINITY_DN519_c0_g1_i4.p2 TRINITY_DN519_c0_g1~~TRINITY_DN519_c0_g1_i4.p2  ORF type:complete len:256 (+),score=29.61 TRINITY_DN519_c0_g1_i4:3-770(+)
MFDMIEKSKKKELEEAKQKTRYEVPLIEEKELIVEEPSVKTSIMGIMALQMSAPRSVRLQSSQSALRQPSLITSRFSGLFGSQICNNLSIGINGQLIQRSPLLIVAKQPVPGKTTISQKQKRKRINQNGKLIKYKLHVKTGDTVVVIAGKDKGKVSTVEKVNKREGLVILKDLKKTTRYLKPQAEGEKAQMYLAEAYMHSSNVMHWSTTEQVRSRLGHKIVDGKKVRYLIKTGEIVPELPYERKERKKLPKEDKE